MAIISIPTSLGGLNIPGGIFGGPLSGLTDSDGTFFYQYPRDLGSSTRAHSVFFTIEEIEEVSLAQFEGFVSEGVDALGNEITDFAGSFGESGGILDQVSGLFGSATEGAKQLYEGGVSNAIKSAFGGFTSVLKTTGGLYEAAGEFLNQQQTKIIGHVGLYMPENFNLTSSLSYDDNTSIASAMGALPLIGGAIKSATSVVEGGQNDALKLVLNRAGYVFNPQKQILFQGVEFRDFDMSFTFTPYSAAEAEQVKKIIEKFRMYAAPKRNTEVGKNMFWVPPALFNIEFRYQGQQNPNLPRLKKCVVESINVNYTPNGWAAYGDGAPVQTTMTIQFKEIALIGRDDISQGY